MIKKIGTIVILVFFVLQASLFTVSGLPDRQQTSNKEPIAASVAYQIVQAKLQELKKTMYTIEPPTFLMNNENTILGFIFALVPQGYMVVTAWNDLPPVIAYSFTSSAREEPGSVNIFQQLLIADLNLRLQNVASLPSSLLETRHQEWTMLLKDKNRVTTGGFEQWPPEGSTTTEGWVETNWHQEAPYNMFCPLDIANGGDRSVAGCPSTAMAQILNYHETLNNVYFSDLDDYHHTYGGNNYWIDNDHDTYDFPSYPELNTYLATLATHYQQHTTPTDTDAAALTFACGVAARQVYGSAGSGTFGVNQAYDAYLKFNCTNCTLLHPTDADVYGRLAKNMIDALPAHLAIVNEDWTAGHNVVVDGYNTDNFFHINFGWGGLYNGWYLLPDDLPYSLTVLEGVIVDILDDATGPKVSCGGSLFWTDIQPGETVTGNFTVKNVGTPGSLLDWEITDTPDWGTWTITPESGTDLSPEEGPITLNVSVTAPTKKNRDYSGYIRVINSDDPTDCYIVQVVLATPDIHPSPLFQFIKNLCERFPHAFPFLRLLMNF